MTPEEFYEAYYPYALSVTEKTGVDPRLVLSQAALETGYGRSAPGNNFFGIKSHGRSGGRDLMTTEVEDGRVVKKRQSFRGYSDPSESFDDYADFLLENPRYKDVLASETLGDQIAAMGESGYATDPDYASKLSQISARFTGQRPQSTPEARRAQYGLGDRDPGTTTDVLKAVKRGDMTKDEAQKYVSEELLQGVEGGSAYDTLQDEKIGLGDFMASMEALEQVGQAPEPTVVSSGPATFPNSRTNVLSARARSARPGSQAIGRLGLESLLAQNPLLGIR